jgi:hypothetical protein
MSSDPIRGATIRWTYEDGPVKGKAFEHNFGEDGQVTWRCTTDGKQAGRNQYQTARVSDGVHAISYLAESGYTLTTVLDFGTGNMVSFASNEKQLVMQRGKFEALRRGA